MRSEVPACLVGYCKTQARLGVAGAGAPAEPGTPPTMSIAKSASVYDECFPFDLIAKRPPRGLTRARGAPEAFLTNRLCHNSAIRALRPVRAEGQPATRLQ